MKYSLQNISVADMKHPTLDQNYVDQHCHWFWHSSVLFLLNLFLMLHHLSSRDFNLPRSDYLGISIGSSMFMCSKNQESRDTC